MSIHYHANCLRTTIFKWLLISTSGLEPQHSHWINCQASHCSNIRKLCESEHPKAHIIHTASLYCHTWIQYMNTAKHWYHHILCSKWHTHLKASLQNLYHMCKPWIMTCLYRTCHSWVQNTVSLLLRGIFTAVFQICHSVFTEFEMEWSTIMMAVMWCSMRYILLLIAGYSITDILGEPDHLYHHTTQQQATSHIHNQ